MPGTWQYYYWTFRMLSEQDIDVDFAEFGIITYDESNYMLIGIDETNGLEAAVGLVKIGFVTPIVILVKRQKLL
ncbi:MAG: hypothetical protein U9R60_07805 [Bacteroidota bacterium]|nr:hypothetical protein [Bacteroidota bacterium]